MTEVGSKMNLFGVSDTIKKETFTTEKSLFLLY